MPANGKYLLDTNIVIGLLNGDDRIREAIRIAAEVFIPVIVAGELYFGAAKSGPARS
jgi:tRNA(fMet)-specific endonuclease VapC